MNPFLNLDSALWLAGVGHFGILIASALTPKVLQWREAFQPLPPFLRALFWVYGGFIVLVIAGLGVLTLAFRSEMAAGEPVARGLAGFIAVFWGARLGVQWFVFDARPYLTTCWHLAGYHTLTAAFLYLTTVYAAAALRLDFQWLKP